MTTTNHTEIAEYLRGSLRTFATEDDAIDFAQWGDEGESAEAAAAEIAAENGWLRHAEYDPEADAFDRWEASMGVVPFDVALAEATR